MNIRRPNMEFPQMLLDEDISWEFSTYLMHILRGSNRSTTQWHTSWRHQRYSSTMPGSSIIRPTLFLREMDQSEKKISKRFTILKEETVQISGYFSFLPTSRDKCTKNRRTRCGNRFSSTAQMQLRNPSLKMTFAQWMLTKRDLKHLVHSYYASMGRVQLAPTYHTTCN